MKKAVIFLKKYRLLVALSLAVIALVYAVWDLTWAQRSHVLERAIIHGFCAMAVLRIFQIGTWFAERKLRLPSLRGRWFFIFPGVFALLTIFLREPGDVAAGGPLVKSYLDLCSWVAGMILAAWGDWRLRERMAVCWQEIEGR